MKTLVNPTMIICILRCSYYNIHGIFVSETVDAHFINNVRMEDTGHEVKFGKIVYEKFAKNKKHDTKICLQ